MKNYFLKQIFTFVLIVVAMNSFAYNYVISGGVYGANGYGVANEKIVVSGQDATTGFQTVELTDSMGRFNILLNFDENTIHTVMVEYLSYCNDIQTQYLTIAAAGNSDILFNYCGSVTPSSCFADFYYEVDSTNYKTLHFYDASYSENQNYDLTWAFGDGTVSSEKNPTHTFDKDGNYYVNLTISSDSCQNSIYSSVYVGNDSVIYTECYPKFWYYQDYTNPYLVYFQNESYVLSNSLYTTWDFGDGTTSNEFSPIHYYSQNGIYIVSLTIQSEICGTLTYTSEIYIDDANYPTDCYANFYYDKTDETGLSFNFYNYSWIANPNYLVSWDFGDNTSSNEFNPAHTYDSEGNYLVTLNIESDSCSSSYQQYVYAGIDSIFIDDCFASFWYYQDWTNPYQVYFQNDTYMMTNAFVTKWDFGDGTTSNEFAPIHVYSANGQYFVTLTIQNEICGTISYSSIVYIDNTIYPTNCSANFYYDTDFTGYNFNFYDASWTASTTHSVAWDFGDNSFSTELNPTHTYTTDGNYLVTLTISSDSCASVYQEYVYVGTSNWYPQVCQAFFYPQYNYEVARQINFTDFSYGNGEILSYTWTFGDGSGSTLQNPEHIYNADGEYLVTLTIKTLECSSTFYEYVYVQDWTNISYCQSLFFPEFDGSLDVKFYDLSMPAPTTWTWNFGDNTTSNEQNPVHSFSGPGIYFVTLETTSENGCYSAFQMEIEIYEIFGKGVTYGGEIIAAYAILDTETSIETVKNDVNSIKFYPNPVNDILNINISNKFENANIQIYNVTGQMIYNKIITNSNFEINTTNFSNGLYVAKINVDGVVSNIKFVK